MIKNWQLNLLLIVLRRVIIFIFFKLFNASSFFTNGGIINRVQLGEIKGVHANISNEILELLFFIKVML